VNTEGGNKRERRNDGKALRAARKRKRANVIVVFNQASVICPSRPTGGTRGVGSKERPIQAGMKPRKVLGKGGGVFSSKSSR